MAIPLQLTFRGMDPSDFVADAVRFRLDRLEHFEHRIQHCTVVVEQPNHSHRHGQTFHVRIDLSIPDRVITVAHDPALDPTHTNVYVAIADAFRAARRQLQDHSRIERGDVKARA